MKEITLLDSEAYTIPSHYRSIEQGIYRDLKDEGDTCFRMPIGFKLDEGECMQYPLEDILDEYYLHISEFILSTGSYNAVVLAGELEDLQRAKYILGKKISYWFAIIHLPIVLLIYGMPFLLLYIGKEKEYFLS